MNIKIFFNKLHYSCICNLC